MRKIRRPGALAQDPLAITLRDALRCATPHEALELTVNRALHGEDPRLAEIVRRCDFDGELTHNVARDLALSPRQFFRYRAAALRAIASRLERVWAGDHDLAATSGSAEARRAYAMGRYLLNRCEPGSVHGAIRRLQHAVQSDPSYVDAWVAVAWANVSLALASSGDGGAAFRRARAALAEASGWNPRSARVRAEEAVLALWEARDPVRARALAEDALACDPGAARAHYVLAWTAVLGGDLARAARAFDDAAQADPGGFLYLAAGMTVPFFRTDYDAAAQRSRELLELEPDNMFVLGYLVESLNALGRYDETVATVEAHLARGAAAPAWLTAYTRALAFLGDTERARAQHRAFEGPHAMRAAIAVALGEDVAALNELELAAVEGNGMIDIAVYDPAFAPLQDEKRFKRLVRYRAAS